METVVETITYCSHCGDECASSKINIGQAIFCCQGCKTVYELLHSHDLDNYYCLNEKPGQKIEAIPQEKFAYLEEETIIQKLLLFKNNHQAQVAFYLPQMHCSSCLWLLENLSQINDDILASQVNFNQKTVKITFQIDRLSIRELAEMLAYLGYEPVIDLYDNQEKENKKRSKRAYLKLGVTGFFMGNIMLIAFPEYVGLDPEKNPDLNLFFNFANVLLSLPIVFYSANEFFINAWYSLRQRYINIDTPIALAIAVTFLRSLYEVFTQTGGGFFDSLASITFFMLLGRTIQNRSNASLRFNRDYKSYFPIAVARIKDGLRSMIRIEDIEENDVLVIHHQEVIPTDCMLSKGDGEIDYSFVTGEDKIERIDKGEVVYAGGRNVGKTIEVLAVKPFDQNSFTQLWNNEAFHQVESERGSRITMMGRYFAFITIFISLSAFVYWTFQGNSMIAWQAATAVLIIACPCSLLLTSSFTNGYVIHRFSQFGMYLKNAMVLEKMGNVNFLAFDKTGTLTTPNKSDLKIELMDLSDDEIDKLTFITSQSLHPLSRAITEYYSLVPEPINKYSANVNEWMGQGMHSIIGSDEFKVGSAQFVGITAPPEETTVYVSVNGEVKAIFTFESSLLSGAREMINDLKDDYEMVLISGDNTSSRKVLSSLFGTEGNLHYRMSPEEKLQYVKARQNEGKVVAMIGDGLNDAGALSQSDVGISVVKSSFAFTPSCDAIMDVRKLSLLPYFFKWAKGTKKLVNFGFVFSILFNIVGLSFALRGDLTPLVAAILMTSSTLTIISIAYLGSKSMVRLPPKSKFAKAVPTSFTMLPKEA